MTRPEALLNVKCSVPNLLPILASLKRKIVLSRLQAVCMRCMQTDYPSYALQEYWITSRPGEVGGVSISMSVVCIVLFILASIHIQYTSIFTKAPTSFFFNEYLHKYCVYQCISKSKLKNMPAWAWGNSLLWQRLYLLRNSRHRTVGSQTIKMMRKSLETEPSRWSGPVNNKMNESCVNIMEF